MYILHISSCVYYAVRLRCMKYSFVMHVLNVFKLAFLQMNTKKHMCDIPNISIFRET